MTAARPAIPFATEALTRRTCFRKAALGHWDPRVQQAWLYNLADAAQKHDVEVHHTALVLNHHHTDVTPRLANISAFLHQLHHPMSCAVNNILQQRGFDAMDDVWDGQQPHRMRLVDVAATMSQLIYEKVQAVAAGLVDRPEHMPGFNFDWSMWRAGCIIKVDAPENTYFDLRYREKTLDLDFLPQARLLALFDWNVEQLIYWMRKLENIAIRKILSARTRPCRGAAAVLKIHPFDEPRTRRETRGRSIPTFRIGARGMIGREWRIRSSMETTRFRQEHAESSRAFREGAHDHVFPYGTDKMARTYGAKTEEAPKEGAILMAPGMSREELWEQHPRSSAGLSAEARLVLEEVKRALGDEAPLFEEFSESVFVGSRAATRRASKREDVDVKNVHVETDANVSTLPQAVDEVAIQKLRGPRKTSVKTPPRRIVVLRTRYPTKQPGPHPVPRTGRRAGDEPDD